MSDSRRLDLERPILEIEKCTTTLTIIADACAHGAYTSTANVESALVLVADHISKNTKLMMEILFPDAGGVDGN
jgi:hypothetical protein